MAATCCLCEPESCKALRLATKGIGFPMTVISSGWHIGSCSSESLHNMRPKIRLRSCAVCVFLVIMDHILCNRYAFPFRPFLAGGSCVCCDRPTAGHWSCRVPRTSTIFGWLDCGVGPGDMDQLVQVQLWTWSLSVNALARNSKPICCLLTPTEALYKSVYSSIPSDQWHRICTGVCVRACADKSHWDLVVKNSTYIDGLLTVLEVS